MELIFPCDLDLTTTTVSILVILVDEGKEMGPLISGKFCIGEKLYFGQIILKPGFTDASQIFLGGMEW